jgi:glycosyltransferase involved in cell wall biosynthesis
MDPKKGGVCQAVRTVIHGLTELGVHNEVLCMNSPESSFLKEDRFIIHAVGNAKGPWAYHPNLVPWMLQNFHHFDIVVIHGLWQYHGYAVRLAMRKHKAELHTGKSDTPKLYVMPHGMLDPYFQRAEGRKLKAIRNVIYWKLIEGRVINDADGLLFTCEEECRLARTTFTPYHPKKEFVVGMGVEQPPVFTDKMRKAFLEKCPTVGERPYLLFLSRIHEKKGVDLLIKAYNEVFGAFKNSGSAYPALVIAGPDLESPYGQSIQKLASGSELSDSIYFPGMLSKDSKWGAFYGCEAFVLPSHQENFGIAVVEALACGKPVLISNQVNIWREIESSGGGVVADDSFAGTTQLLKSWKDLSNKGKALGVDARLTFEKNFAIEPVALRMMNLISSDFRS